MSVAYCVEPNWFRVLLSEDGFRQLVAGQPVTVTCYDQNREPVRLQVGLDDIGWMNIVVAVTEAMQAANAYPQPGEQM